MELDMSFPLLSFMAPLLAVTLGGLIVLVLDWWWRG
jgi:hypothetical protein